MANEKAPEGTVYVCGACGKTSRWHYGWDDAGRDSDDAGRYASPGWDSSCVTWATLCTEATLVRGASGLVVSASAVSS